MSMCCTLRSVSDESLARMFDDFDLLWEFLTPDANTGSGLDGLIKFVPRDLSSLGFAKGETVTMDLYKEWHGIHYCLTQSDSEGDPPLNFILDGGEELDFDADYGPPRAFNSTAVKEIHAELSLITLETFRQRYDPAEMDLLEIYSGNWVLEEEENLECLSIYFTALKDFISYCHQHNLGMIVEIT